MTCTAFPLLQKFRPHQTVLPPWLAYVLQNESKLYNLPEKAYNYLKCIQSLSTIKKLEIEDYFVTLTLCLYLEQYEINKEMKQHALKNYMLRKTNAGHYFIIDVPSLTSENSVIVPDDKVYLYHVLSKKRILAKVVKVSKNEVTIQLQTRLDTELFSNGKFDINFVSQHWPLNCCHHAISVIKMCNWIPLIYPKVRVHSEDVEFDIKWVDCNVAKNEQQKQAVKKILNKTAHPAPYIIFGPPGTGKTATLVETICQIVRQHPADNILVCATSNAAADEITTRLIGKVAENALLRIYAQSRRWEKVAEKIKPYANFIEEKPIFLTRDILIHKKIIITTLVTSLRLTAAEFRKSHFSYIIIDEASQAIEPEMLIPFSIMSFDSSSVTNFHPQVVIAGDPHQLGPVVRSKRSEHLLGISMLERLMINCEPYKKQNGKYDQNYITKLIKNYRSHERLLYIPNKLFYDEDLIACGGVDTNIALNWSKLPNKDFPMIFQEVCGDEKRTLTKSVCNEVEALVAVHYVRMLIQTSFANHKITAKDIGIITPFKRQQQDIIQQLAAKHLDDVTVGTVEIFQGQEKRIIIISTVRSKTFEHDGKEHIGFLSNQKRFNVALTRAKALTIVIGDPNILCTNKNWKELWKYCKCNGACIPFEECPLKPNAIKKLMNEKAQNSINKLSFTVLNRDKENSNTLSNVLVCKMHEMKL